MYILYTLVIINTPSMHPCATSTLNQYTPNLTHPYPKDTPQSINFEVGEDAIDVYS